MLNIDAKTFLLWCCFSCPSETDMFFLAINMVGTDFSMICQLFPHRARSEIKVSYTESDNEEAFWDLTKHTTQRLCVWPFRTSSKKKSVWTPGGSTKLSVSVQSVFLHSIIIILVLLHPKGDVSFVGERRKLDLEYFSKLLEKILEVHRNRKKLKSLSAKNSPKKGKRQTKSKDDLSTCPMFSALQAFCTDLTTVFCH